MTPVSAADNHDIRHLLYRCGHQVEQLLAQPLEVSQKGPNDFVTSVDLALNQILSTTIAARFPRDGVITEESPQSRQAFHAGYARLWCIDPLDGTDNFIRGKWEYATMIGLLEHQQPIAGWLYAPAYHQLYCGGANWGVFTAFGEQPLTPLAVTEPAPPSAGFCPVLIGYSDHKRFGQAIVQRIPNVQFYSIGSFGLKVMEVIQGRAGLYVYLNQRVKVWDTVGPLALAQAAGLVCCDLDGQAIGFTNRDLDAASLTHRQAIVVGWRAYVEAVLPQVRQAVHETLQSK